MLPEENSLTILVIEDNPGDFCLIESMLDSSAMSIKNIYSASRISEAAEILQHQQADLVFLDLSLPDSFGLASFHKIKSLVQNIPVIILTGQSESAVALKALQLGAQDYLVKGEFNTALLVKSAEYSIERKKAEEKILASEKNYRQMFNKNPFAAWIYNIDTLFILEVNDAAIKKYGYSREEFLTLKTSDIIKPDPFHTTQSLAALNDNAAQWQKKLSHHTRKSGENIIMEATAYKINYFGQTAMQVQLNDVTEKLRLERDLQLEHKLRQQQIAQAILKTQEEEKKMLGAELHDNINQILATANLYISSVLKKHGNIEELVTKGHECISLAIEEIRKLSRNLITPVLVSGNLRHAIEGMTTDIGQIKNITIKNQLEMLDSILLTDIQKITIYRIIQEQLNNILKHAEATEIKITIGSNQHNISLSIADNGKGFDTDLAREGIGLINIKNRAELFNGKVIMVSSPGNGCILKVELDIESILPKAAA